MRKASIWAACVGLLWSAASSAVPVYYTYGYFGEGRSYENGDQASIGTEIPDDFPVDDVPLMEGTVLSATAVDGATYMVMLELEGTPEEVQEEALGMLTDAGYTTDSTTNAEGFFTAELSKEGFTVGLSSFDNVGTTNLQYIVGVS